MGLPRSIVFRGCLTCAAWLAGTLAFAGDLPPEVQAALDRAKVPASAMVALVQEVDAARPRLAWQANEPVNPASLMKLFTTFAGLELLGPAWRWSTPVWLAGSVRDGVLDGNLVIKGSGDPTLVMERMWLLLHRVQQLGVREIRGDIVLDRSAFLLPEHDPAAFDGEPLRPHNVGPDALLLNFKSITLTFSPQPVSDAVRGLALVSSDPPLAGTVIDASLPLVAGACDDWRAGVRLDSADPLRLRLAGAYPASCGDLQWPIAAPDPRGYNARALAGMWSEIGGSLSGSVRDGVAPASKPSFEVASPALAEVVRDVNKFSNNVMAQQLFLTLALAQRGSGTPQGAREVLREWIELRLGPQAAADVVIDNGSGLSRVSRANALALARLLMVAWSSPVMPELMSSLPVGGIDGTLRRSRTQLGRAHLKTGSLRDVVGIAGYVLAANGRRHVVVAIVNHPNANAARPALEALTQWASAEPAPGRQR